MEKEIALVGYQTGVERDEFGVIGGGADNVIRGMVIGTMIRHVFYGGGWWRIRPSAGGKRVDDRDDRGGLPPIADAGDWRRAVAVDELHRDNRDCSRPGRDHNANR